MIELLYKKKIIRDFLSLFTENHWKQLISSLVEFGIINLKKQHKITSLTAEEIIQIVENLKQGENLIEIKPKMTINKLLNKNASQKGANTSESRSRSKSKNSDPKFHKNSAKKSATISKSKSPDTKIRANSNKKTSANIKRENSSDKSKNILGGFQFDSVKNKEGEITNHKNSNKSNDRNDKNYHLPYKKEISSSSLSGRVARSNLKEKEETVNDTKNQFPIKKVSNHNNNHNSKNHNKNNTTEYETDAIHVTNKIKNYNTPAYNSNNYHSVQNSNTKANTSNIANKSYLNLTTDQRVNTSVSNIEEKERRISSSKVITDGKKKNTRQILEQINLNKLKEKIKSSELNLCKSNEDEINAKIPNLSRKFSKVESKIKSEIEKDKKIFNLIKNSNEAVNLPQDERKENSNSEKVINTNIRLKKVGNVNTSPEKYQDYSPPLNIKNAHAQNTMNTIRANQNQNIMDRKESDKTNAAAVISLENRLNGLTQKIADVEKNSKQSDLNINPQLTNKMNYNYTNNNNYKAYNEYNAHADLSYDKYSSSPMIINNTHIPGYNQPNQYLQNPQSQNKNITFQNESTQENAIKNQANESDYYLYKNNTSRNDEDYLNDDKYDIDLNKYKYLNQNNYMQDNAHNYNDHDDNDNDIDIDDNLHDDYEY